VEKVRLFGIDLDAVRMDQAVSAVFSMIRQNGGACRFVVTPNVDHVLLFQRTEALRLAYSEAALIVADGLPVVLASYLLGHPLPERVPGSDLVPAVLGAARADDPLRVFLLGAGPGVAQRAARRIEALWAGVRVVGTSCPPLGFEGDPAQNEAILRQVTESGAQLLIVGLGAPKQELWVHAHRARITAPVAMCVGATIDFLAGEKPRAPEWMQRSGLEWLHRMMSEPKRLVPRYASNAVGFPLLVLKEWRTRAAER
jgi:N-acetylglucosaminyldiphosphoundecaprenol N-acetyl-beta-D-mannosaminyltransferase